MITRADCLARDAGDALAPLRSLFALERADAEGIIYLDGNSLGVLPRATAGRLQQVIEDEWGAGLIRSWNSAGWVSLSQRIAGKIARLVGAAPEEVVVADSTSVNLFKVLSAALALADEGRRKSGADGGAPRRRRIVSERTNFPSDLYIADTLAQSQGFELVLVDEREIGEQLDDRLAVLLLTEVNYRTGRRHSMAGLTRAAHDAGAIAIWDLAHSAGAMPVHLHGDTRAEAADFAVGCGYKYLNGGPGAPAFAWAHPQHTARMDRDAWRQPLSGWFGHAAPFEFTPDYRPGPGMSRFHCGTPPVLSLAALECGVDTVLAAEAHGGLARRPPQVGRAH